MVMAVNGTLLTEDMARRLKEAGIQRLCISLDGAQAPSHDNLRAVPGAFEGALRGIAASKSRGVALSDQHHRHPGQPGGTAGHLRAGHQARGRGPPRLCAGAHRPGRADIRARSWCPRRNTKQTLRWMLDRQKEGRLLLKPTCAPQFYRLWREDARARGEKITPPDPRHGGHDQGVPGRTGLRLRVL